MATELIRFTQWAREQPQRQYNALMGMLMDPQGLHASFERQAGSKAPGIDGMRKADYAVDLPERLAELSARLRRLGYRPKPVRRVYIPKSNAGRRALGVPSFEDRLVQDRLSGILQAIWEPEFRDCSYGFRPQRNAHQALKRLAEVITLDRTQWIVEADIKGFFDQPSQCPPQEPTFLSKVSSLSLPALSFRSATSVAGLSGKRYNFVRASRASAMVPLWIRS